MWQETKMVYFIFMSVIQKEHILVFWLLVGLVFVVWKKNAILKKFGIKTDDFKDLKWEDEPVEVFVNMED